MTITLSANISVVAGKDLIFGAASGDIDIMYAEQTEVPGDRIPQLLSTEDGRPWFGAPAMRFQLTVAWNGSNVPHSMASLFMASPIQAV